MVRPYWSGQFQISLVSFGIELFPATEAKSEIHFHQLNRNTGERVRHQNVSSQDEPVETDEIVKGYEYSKGEYVMIEPEDIENLRIPSRQTLEVAQFVQRDELEPKFFEKPYFVVPANPTQAEAFAVVRKAMQSTGKIALGKIAFGGREHLIAVSAPENDDDQGMMAYTMRYSEELRNPAEFFSSIKRTTIDQDQLALAKELILRKAAPFDPDKFTDDYETALRAMIDAKVKHAPLPKNAPTTKSTKVVSLMDALRKSVGSEAQVSGQKPARAKKSTAAASSGKAGKNVAMINSTRKPVARASKANHKRKSA